MSDAQTIADVIDALDETEFEYDAQPSLGSDQIAINQKHILLLVPKFKAGRVDFLRLARESKNVMFEGSLIHPLLPEGKSLTQGQIKQIHAAWLARKAEIDSAAVAEPEPIE